MTAELLREAAARMRERAEAATPSPWSPHHKWPEYVMPPAAPGRERIAAADSDGSGIHIASWHPAVALAVADLLDIVVAGYEEYVPEDDGESEMQIVSSWADNLARAYLGTTP